MKNVFIIIALLVLPVTSWSQTTLEQCQQAAEKNYPLIRQYDLIKQTTELTVANISKKWLPQVTADAQATLQSDVAAWPDEMRAMLSATELDIKGLKKDQYRVGVELRQTIIDGGAVSSEKAVARAQGDVEVIQNEVTLYGIRSRVNEMYFSVLLLDENIKLAADLEKVFEANEAKLKSLSDGGAAAESDYLTMRAERLSTHQRSVQLQSARKALLSMLSTFCGLEVAQVVKPSPDVSLSRDNNRPELRLFNSQLNLVDARERQLDAALMPRMSLFAQGYWGYPGYNMFEDMISHRFSLNGMVGVKLSWNLGALYTRSNVKKALSLQRRSIENSRDAFLLNNSVEKARLDEELSLYRSLMDSDNEIVSLRSQVRKASQSRLDHGIIDVSDLVKEIHNEHAAMLNRSTHEVEMLKRIYDIKTLTNN